jgi:hypothetical protein
MPPGHDGISDDAGLPFAWAAKLDICWLKCCSPHSGQLTLPRSSERRTSFSNFVPQESHLYSNMGIGFP